MRILIKDKKKNIASERGEMKEEEKISFFYFYTDNINSIYKKKEIIY